MPNALASVGTVTRQLSTLEGGEVTLKRMTYGQKLERQGMVKIHFGGGGDRRSRNADFKGELEMANRMVTYFEFKHCIVDHNLTDGFDVKLNLADPNVIDLLDPRIGEEIESLISELNNFEDDEKN